MDILIQLLQTFEEDESIPTNQNDLILNQEVEAIACTLLIDLEGHCNGSNIDMLKEAGFYVIPIEQDRFGWLIGGIVTKKGIITYG